MKKTLSILFISLLSMQAYAVDGTRVIGARSIGMGGVATTLQDLWSSYNNQAGLAYLKNMEVGLSYESKFSLGELSEKSFAFALPTKSGVFALVATSYGYSDYSESKYGLSYGRKLAENISIGLQINYQSIRLAEPYGSKSLVSGELGIMADITEDLRMGAHISNPMRPVLSDEPEEKIASAMSIGAAYSFSDVAVLAIEADKVVDQDPSFNAGIEYFYAEKLFIRAGIGTGPIRTNFGLGMVWGSMHFNAAVWNHQLLGLSPSFSLSYEFYK